MRSLSLVAIAEAHNTASATTNPRNMGKNGRFLGPVRATFERAASVGGGTIYGASLLGLGNSSRQDFKGDGVSTNYDSLLTYVANSNYNWLVKCDLLARTGTVTTTANSTTVTGSGTAFTTELAVGDEIQVGGERRFVQSITSATVLIVDTAFVTASAAVAIYSIDAILIYTTDYTIVTNGGLARITLAAAAKVPSGAKLELHYIGTPTTLFTFVTATLQFKQLELQGTEILWYVTDATATPSATNLYVEPTGE